MLASIVASHHKALIAPRGPSVRSFCSSHPAGVDCLYCRTHPVITIIRSEQQCLDIARAAQSAYWDAMSVLECTANLDIDWESIDLSEHTIDSLRQEFTP